MLPTTRVISSCHVTNKITKQPMHLNQHDMTPPIYTSNHPNDDIGEFSEPPFAQLPTDVSPYNCHTTISSYHETTMIPQVPTSLTNSSSYSLPHGRTYYGSDMVDDYQPQLNTTVSEYGDNYEFCTPPLEVVNSPRTPSGYWLDDQTNYHSSYDIERQHQPVTTNYSKEYQPTSPYLAHHGTHPAFEPTTNSQFLLFVPSPNHRQQFIGNQVDCGVQNVNSVGEDYEIQKNAAQSNNFNTTRWSVQRQNDTAYSLLQQYQGASREAHSPYRPCLYEGFPNTTQANILIIPERHEDKRETDLYTRIGCYQRPKEEYGNELRSSCMFQAKQETLDASFTELPKQIDMRNDDSKAFVVNPTESQDLFDPVSKTNNDGRRSKRKKADCQCKICGKVLSRLTTLKNHMRVHTGDRPYKCTTCGKTFSQAGLLQSHNRIHTGERPFTCSHCFKKFSHAGALKTHIRTHTKQKPYKCKVNGCERAFTDASTLAKHTRTHTGDRPYTCLICNKRFTQSGNMHKHRKHVHKIENYKSKNTPPLTEQDKYDVAQLTLQSSIPRKSNINAFI